MKSAHVFHVCLSAYTNLSWLSVTTKRPDPMHAQFKPLQIWFIWYFCHAGFQDAPRLKYPLYFPITLTCYLNLLVTFIVFLSWFKMVYTAEADTIGTPPRSTPRILLWSCSYGPAWEATGAGLTALTMSLELLKPRLSRSYPQATSPFHSQLAGEQERALSPQDNNTPQQDPCSSESGSR